MSPVTELVARITIISPAITLPVTAPRITAAFAEMAALLTPCFRRRSATGTPLSASLQDPDDLALTEFGLPHDRS